MGTRVLLTCRAAVVLTSLTMAFPAPVPGPWAATTGFAPGEGGDETLARVVRQHADRLGSLGSENEALAFYRSDVAQALAIEDTTPLLEPARARRRRPGTVPPPVLKGPALSLVRALARWSTARSLREAVEGGTMSTLAALEQRWRENGEWLLDGSDGDPLRQAVRMAGVIAAVPETREASASLTTDYLDLAAYLDRTYPSLTSGPASWVAVARREGAAGVRQRMLEHRQGDGHSDVSEEAMRLYFNSRLKPVFLAQAAASALLAEAGAQRHAVRSWRELRSWREEWSTARGRARLCGTWTWIVHNHQNHQDHKMVVTFPPHGTTQSGPRLPKTIVVLGDSVYLRWEFPGGYQEDSLLFSGNDRRLEGTFVNSRGPYGAITGRRVRPCGAEP